MIDCGGNITLVNSTFINNQIEKFSHAGGNISKSNCIFINPVDPEINLTVRDVFENETVIINITVAGYINNVSVSVDSDVEIIDVNKTLILNINNLNIGKHSVNVKFGGNDYYLKSEKLVEFYVKNKPVRGFLNVTVPPNAICNPCSNPCLTSSLLNGQQCKIPPLFTLYFLIMAIVSSTASLECITTGKSNFFASFN